MLSGCCSQVSRIIRTHPGTLAIPVFLFAVLCGLSIFGVIEVRVLTHDALRLWKVATMYQQPYVHLEACKNHQKFDMSTITCISYLLPCALADCAPGKRERVFCFSCIRHAVLACSMHSA